MTVALCVNTYDRPDRLQQLLESAANVGIDLVCVADGGPTTAAKREVYERAYGSAYAFDVITLRGNTGLGAGRRAAYEAVAPFADWIVAADDDHVLTDGLWLLIEQLEADETLGGLAGDIVEPENGLRWQSAKDFRDTDEAILRTAAVDKQPRAVAGGVIYPFDFIPYPAVYRGDALADYAWDDGYPLGRCHADLYVGHWRRTDWQFGINPDVTFRHYPGDDSISATRDDREEAMDAARQRFREKWGKPLMMGQAYWHRERLADA